MKPYIFAYSVWTHEAGPYSRKIGEFTDSGAVLVPDGVEAYVMAAQMIRDQYPREQGYFISVSGVRELPAAIVEHVIGEVLEGNSAL